MPDIESNLDTRGRLNLNGSVTSIIERSGDTDWFRIRLDAGQRVRFDLQGSPTGHGTLRDTYLQGIYDSSGNLIGGTSNDDGGTGLDSRVDFTASRTGYYYVSAGAYSTRTGTYRLTATTLSGYLPNRPDLVIRSGTASGNFSAGSRIYANVGVANEGTAPAGSSYVGYYLSTDRTITLSDTRLSQDYTGALGTGRSEFDYQYFNLPTNLAAGTYYIGAIADYTGAVGESNEGNNTRVLRSFTISANDDFTSDTGTQGRLDLGGSATGNIERGGDTDWFRIRLDAGQRVRFDLEGSPTGRGTLGDTYLRGIHDSSGSLISGTTNDDGGTSLNSRVTFTASSSGYYYVSAGAYSSRTGTYRLTATLSGLPSTSPDLVVIGGSVSGNPSAGGSIQANVTVKNQGTARAGASHVGYYLSTDSTITTSDTRLGRDDVGTLNPNGTESDSESFLLPDNLIAGRTYYIGAIADYDGTVSESNEGNNARVLRSFTVPLGRPDLTVTGGTVTGELTPGGRIQVNATVTNRGTATPPEPSRIGYYLSTDSAIETSDTRLGYDFTGTLNPGRSESDSESFLLPTTLVAGRTYYIGAIADYDGTVSESNEGNNARILRSFTVSGRPDLVVGSGTVTGNFTPGGRIEARATVTNRGTVAAGPSRVGYYLSTDSTITISDTRLGYDHTDSLNRNGSDSDSRSLILPTSLVPGSYYIGAIADYTGAVGESNEGNNTRVLRSFTISANDDFTSDTGTQGRLDLGGSATGNIERGGDTDWFRIRLDAGQRVRFDLEGSPTGRGTLGDTYLRGIHDSSGSLISGTTNDDGGTSLNSRVTFTASSTGYYYISAGAYSSSGTGTYRLTATALAAARGGIDRSITRVTSVSVPAAVDDSIDNLVGNTKWGGAIGSGTRLSYSFSSAGSTFNYQNTNMPGYSNMRAILGDSFRALNRAQQQAATSVMNLMSNVCDITFERVEDTSLGAGDVRWTVSNSSSLSTARVADFPSSFPSGGDIWIGPSTQYSNPVSGQYGYHTFLHELGHAVGLEHPHHGRPAPETGEDQMKYSVMSYRDFHPDELDGYETHYYPTTLMINDIAALQYLYGANTSYNSGDDQYSWGSTDSVYACIWDSGGNDTINASNQGDSCTIDLGEGQWSSIGRAFYNGQGNVRDNLTIAYGAVIENAIGSRYSDTIIGNQHGNRIGGGAGNDTLTGGNGADIFRFVSTAEGTDTITDFTSGLDKIEVVSPNFGNLSVGTLSSDRFRSVGTTLTNANAVFLYDNGTGSLSFDRDGYDSAAPVRIATLTGNRNLAFSDIQVAAA
uniref:Serine protease, subtilase family n=1 Tax=Candidatus Kentrum sp. LFY TaxID=2126342 RepID=A0A450UCI4_9GAMM|nr:MAG: Serine protease, subtilase family [Candidatus Kentron sp. LFY]